MEQPKPGAIVHVELSSNDLPATRKFLQAVFGWKFKQESMGDMEYWTFEAASGPGGGLMAPQPGTTPQTLHYVLVQSVDAAVRKITANGGKILMPKQEIPKVGWFAVYQVPGGFTQAIFETIRKS